MSVVRFAIIMPNLARHAELCQLVAFWTAMEWHQSHLPRRSAYEAIISVKWCEAAARKGGREPFAQVVPSLKLLSKKDHFSCSFGRGRSRPRRAHQNIVAVLLAHLWPTPRRPLNRISQILRCDLPALAYTMQGYARCMSFVC